MFIVFFSGERGSLGKKERARWKQSKEGLEQCAWGKKERTLVREEVHEEGEKGTHDNLEADCGSPGDPLLEKGLNF